MKSIKEKYYNNGRLNLLERELLLMVLESIEELKEVSKGNILMEKVTNKIRSLGMEEQIQGYYIKEEQDAWLMRERLKEEEQKAREKGHKEGIKEGIKKGIEKGVEKTNLNNAKRMLENNIDMNVISDVTGLSINVINDLKKDI